MIPCTLELQGLGKKGMRRDGNKGITRGLRNTLF